MRLQFCGVRGSTPAPGAEFVRVGGHTSCVAVWRDGAIQPSLVLDAGTGLQRLTGLMDGAPFRGSMLLTHLHWDHTHGLPFFPPGDRPDARVRLYMPDQRQDPTAVLSRAMSPPHFPIRPDELSGDWVFAGLEPGDHVIEGFLVTAFEVPHKGGRTYGYRVSDEHASIAYIPDHQPRLGGPDPAIVAGIGGADVLIHDAQFLPAELARAQAFGHATVDQAVELARAAGVRELVLFHHAPGRTDDQIDQLLADVSEQEPAVSVAREGRELALVATTGQSAEGALNPGTS